MPQDEQPPSPSKLLILGSLHQLGSLPHRSLQALSRNHGPLMLLHLGKFPTIVVSSADIAQEVLKENDALFDSRPFQSAAHHLLYGQSDMVFSPYEDYWRRVRKVSVRKLLSLKRVQSFKAVREEEAGIVVKEIQSSCSTAAAIDLSDMFLNWSVWSGNIISRAASGKAYRGGDWIDLVTGTKSRLKRNFEAWDAFLDEVIEEKLRESKNDDQDGHPNNLLSVLLQIQRDPAAEIRLTENNVKAIAMGMILAAIDETATALEWTMAELIKNPDAMKKAQEGVKVEEDDTMRMGYLQSVIKEAMRLHPPAPLLIPHETTASTTLRSYQISPNTRVLINAWAIGRNPASWGRNAEEFVPERFMNETVEYKGQDFRFLPFGAGRRGCSGMSFAVSAIQLALANLLYLFDRKMPGDMTKDDLDLTEAMGQTVHMKVPLRRVPTYHFAQLTFSVVHGKVIGHI
ncbi:hypothetical protein ACLOJK_035857 [Asimina triloba]